MSAALLMVSLCVGGQAPTVRIYRFVDAQGTEHFVDHLEQVPEGIHAEPLDLSDVPLNPETAKALEEAAKHPAKSKTVVPKGERPPSEDARRFFLWSGGLTFAFIGLALLARATKQRLPQLAFAFGIVRFAAGSLALMSWAATAYEYRDSRRWLTEHFPPFQMLDRALKTKQQVDQQTQQMERDVDQNLRSP